MKNFSEKLINPAAPTEQAEIEALKQYGWTDEEIADMSPSVRRQLFQEAMGIDDFPREQAVDQAVSARGSPRPEGGEPGGPEAATGGEPETPKRSTGGAPTEHTEIETLKRYGWSDEEIAEMSPKTQRQLFQEAMATGQSKPTAELASTRGNPSKPVEGAPRTRLMKNLSGNLIYGGLGVICLFTIFRVVFEQRETPPVIAGWEGISNCSSMVSFDGKRRLTLSENHFARIDESDRTSTEGGWSFDQNTSKYTITIRDESIIYSVVAPGGGDDCLLVKGDGGPPSELVLFTR
jgi:hypothetical protein